MLYLQVCFLYESVTTNSTEVVANDLILHIDAFELIILYTS